MTVEAPSRSSISLKGQWLLALAGWIACVIIFFWPVVFQGKVLAPLDILDTLLKPWATTKTIDVHNAFTYDAISQYLPYDWSVYQSLRQDGYIGWNPYAHNGTAILENTMLCPGDWHHQLYRFLPFWDAWNLGIILQFSIAGLGMLVFLRSQGIKPVYALTGTISFGFYSQFVLWIYHRWVLGAMCWAPWVLWALLRSRSRRKVFDPLAIVFIGLALRGGHLQAALSIILMVVMVALVDWWQSTDRLRWKTIMQVLLPYTLTGLLASALASDVFLQTIPAYLAGGKEMSSFGWLETVSDLPTLATAFIPTLLGTPQSIDLFKLFNNGLFDIKFLGASCLMFSTLALFSRKAPKIAVAFFIFGLSIPFTPATNWLYSRFTVIFAIGAVWLACWLLNSPPQKISGSRRTWMRFFTLLGAMVLLWGLASAIMVWKHPVISEIVESQILQSIPRDRINRTTWMLERGQSLIQDSLLWHPRNLTFLLLIGAGIFAGYKILVRQSRKNICPCIVLLTTFAELMLFSRTWITFSDRPDSDTDLYNTPTWVESLKEAAGNGAIVVSDRSRFDYLQLNTPSTHGIRFQDGYETVTPLRCQPLDPASFDPSDHAMAGVSLYLAHPDNSATNIVAKGWIPVHESSAFKLYRNPAFSSRILATTPTGQTRPVTLDAETANTRSFTLPPGTHTVHIAETFNKGWTALANGVRMPLQQSAHNGMTLAFEEPLDSPLQISMRYRPWLQPIYLPIILATLLFLGVAPVLQSRK